MESKISPAAAQRRNENAEPSVECIFVATAAPLREKTL
jgi:hypothetical protein